MMRPTALERLMEEVRPRAGWAIYDALQQASCLNAVGLAERAEVTELLEWALRKEAALKEARQAGHGGRHFGGDQPFQELSWRGFDCYLSDDGQILKDLDVGKYNKYKRDRQRQQCPEQFFVEDNIAWVLFGYETAGGRQSPWWKDPTILIDVVANPPRELADQYEQWWHQKRPISQPELRDGRWARIGDDGRFYLMEFHPGNPDYYRQTALFNPTNRVDGEWELLGPILQLRESAFRMDVRLDVIAERQGVVHSGVECRDGRPRAYFKMLQLKGW